MFSVSDKTIERCFAIGALEVKDVLQQPIAEAFPNVVVQLCFEFTKLGLTPGRLLFSPIVFPNLPLIDNVNRCDLSERYP